MNLGFNLPHYGPAAHSADGIVRFAREAEALGAASLWIGDRLLAPVNPTVGYLNFDYFPPEFRSMQDPFIALALAASVTDRIRIGASCLNALWYSPPLLARALTTIDLVSNGRLVAGFGTGWSPEEFQAAGVPFTKRGARMEELLDVLHAWWTTNPVEHHGDLYQVPASNIDIKPVQRPHPPIFLAAFGPQAIRRIGERADGWLMFLSLPESFPLPTPMLDEAWQGIRQTAAACGRDPDAIRKILRINVDAGTSAEDIAGLVQKSHAELTPDEVFVDFAYVTSSADQAIDIAGRVWELVAKG
jgi:probable F420-dependent oxidoreductase